MVGTWFHLEKLYREEGVEIGRSSFLCSPSGRSEGVPLDLGESFYVGDAGGRTGDHNVTDRTYAMNIGIPFFTPEV